MKIQELVVLGQVEVSALIDLPTSKAALSKIAEELGLTPEATRDDIAKQIVIDAIMTGFNDMKYRNSEASSAEEYSLDVEEC